MPVATTNALWLLRVPGDTATLPLVLLTSFAAVATAIAYADVSVARLAILTAVIVRTLLLHFSESLNCYADAANATAMLQLLLEHRVLLQLLLRTRCCNCIKTRCSSSNGNIAGTVAAAHRFKGCP